MMVGYDATSTISEERSEHMLRMRHDQLTERWPVALRVKCTSNRNILVSRCANGRLADISHVDR